MNTNKTPQQLEADSLRVLAFAMYAVEKAHVSHENAKRSVDLAERSWQAARKSLRESRESYRLARETEDELLQLLNTAGLITPEGKIPCALDLTYEYEPEYIV